MPVRKRFGQHFLTDANIIQRIVDAVDPGAAEHILEIGPGRGALTGLLADGAGTLTLVEIDRDLVAELELLYPSATVVSADALRLDFGQIAGPRPLRIVGNLPYNISTPLLFHLYRFADHISDMTFMLQDEVVDRICALPDTPQYGRLSVMSQYYCEPEKLFTVPPGAFHPRPKVMSAIVRLVPCREDRSSDVGCLEETLIAAFSARRKTIRNGLKRLLDEADLADLNISPNARPANLTPEDFLRCAERLARKRRQ